MKTPRVGNPMVAVLLLTSLGCGLFQPRAARGVEVGKVRQERQEIKSAKELGGKEAVLRLKEIALGLPRGESSLQIEACKAIREVGGEEAEEALLELVRGLRASIAKERAITYLGNLGTPSAKLKLVVLLENPEVGHFAARKLERVCRPEDKEVLGQALRLAEQDRLSQKALLAVLQMFASHGFKEAEGLALTLLEKGDLSLRSRALDALRGVGGSKAKQRAWDILRDEKGEWGVQRRSAATVIGALGGHEDTKALAAMYAQLSPVLDGRTSEGLLLRALVEARGMILSRCAPEKRASLKILKRGLDKNILRIETQPPPGSVGTFVSVVSGGKVECRAFVRTNTIIISLPRGTFDIALSGTGTRPRDASVTSVSNFGLLQLVGVESVSSVDEPVLVKGITAREGNATGVRVQSAEEAQALAAVVAEAKKLTATRPCSPVLVLRARVAGWGQTSTEIKPLLKTVPLSRRPLSLLEKEHYVFAEHLGLRGRGLPRGAEPLPEMVVVGFLCRTWDGSYAIAVLDFWPLRDLPQE